MAITDETDWSSRELAGRVLRLGPHARDEIGVPAAGSLCDLALQVSAFDPTEPHPGTTGQVGYDELSAIDVQLAARYCDDAIGVAKAFARFPRPWHEEAVEAAILRGDLVCRRCGAVERDQTVLAACWCEVPSHRRDRFAGQPMEEERF